METLIVHPAERPEFECPKCHHKWFPRKILRKVERMCPECKNLLKDPYWSYRNKPIPRDILIRVAGRCQGKCVKCGATEKLTVDHIIPLKKGGTPAEQNLQILCLSCNGNKATKMVKADA